MFIHRKLAAACAVLALAGVHGSAIAQRSETPLASLRPVPQSEVPWVVAIVEADRAVSPASLLGLRRPLRHFRRVFSRWGNWPEALARRPWRHRRRRSNCNN